MDFFAHQDQAKRNSRMLLLWFGLAILANALVFYFGVAWIIVASSPRLADGSRLPLWDFHLFVTVACTLSGVILTVTLYKLLQVSKVGGTQIAIELGGRLLARTSTDPLDRQLINIVDEMAIASGIPAPPVYVLDAEQAINAFAAGTLPNRSIIAVTRGALEQLPRDEMQGVIAHEFSHILNGDVRLNLRMVGVLHGLFIVGLLGRKLCSPYPGYHFGSINGRMHRDFRLYFLGILLIFFGYFSQICGRIIKAGISRQREYLADSAAVQFTRLPSGLSRALQRIARQNRQILHPYAEEASHMFISAHLCNTSSWLATHPPLSERIRRIDPSAELDALPEDHADVSTREKVASTLNHLFATADANACAHLNATHPSETEQYCNANEQAPSPAATISGQIGELTQQQIEHGSILLQRLPHEIVNAARSIAGAGAIALALQLPVKTSPPNAQLDEIRRRLGDRACKNVAYLYQWLLTADESLRLPLLDLCLPTFKELPITSRELLCASSQAINDLEAGTSLLSGLMCHLIQQALSQNRRRAVMLVSSKTRHNDVATLLALLAQAGNPGDAIAARQAWDEGIANAPLTGPWPEPNLTSQASMQELDALLDRLSNSDWTFQKKLVTACSIAISHNGLVTPGEAELLRATCMAFNLPVPPQLRYYGSIANAAAAA